ncbi:MAG: hypothetical protein ABIH66_02395 [bacterium]
MSEGAHFELGMDRWDVAAELKDKKGNRYYITFSFIRSGAMTLHYRHGMAGLYDAKNDRYLHMTFAPVIFAKAAKHDLLKEADNNPYESARLKEAAERIENDDYRNFLPLEEIPAVYRNQLFINHEKLHFNRTSQKEFLYSLLAPVSKKTVVSLKMEAIANPAIFDSKKPLINQGKSQLQGYVFPSVRFEGVISKGKKKARVTGRGYYSHVFGSPSPAWFKNYREIFIDMDSGGFLIIYAYINPDGAPLGHRAFLLEPDGSVRDVEQLALKQGGEWKSGLSFLEYPEKMEIDSNSIKGEVKILSRKTEEHLTEGRGAHFFGPCGFEGKDGDGKGLNGGGFCRMIVPGQ